MLPIRNAGCQARNQAMQAIKCITTKNNDVRKTANTAVNRKVNFCPDSTHGQTRGLSTALLNNTGAVSGSHSGVDITASGGPISKRSFSTGTGLPCLSSICEKVERYCNRPDPLKVAVKVEDRGGSDRTGSGFYYDWDGHVVTCESVVGRMNGPWHCRSEYDSGKQYHLLGKDETIDIAVLKPDLERTVFRTRREFNSPEPAPKENSCSFLKSLQVSSLVDGWRSKLATSDVRGGTFLKHYNHESHNFFSFRHRPKSAGGFVTSGSSFEGMHAGAVYSKAEPDYKFKTGDRIIPARAVDYCTRSIIAYGNIVHCDLGIMIYEQPGTQTLHVVLGNMTGVETGDEILAVNDEEVSSMRDFSKALSKINLLKENLSRKKVTVRVKRGGEVMTINSAVYRKDYQQPFVYGAF